MVGDQTHLDYLYVLTVADVRGTNPKLWNNWKASLFRDFYERIRRALRRGIEAPVDRSNWSPRPRRTRWNCWRRRAYRQSAQRPSGRA